MGCMRELCAAVPSTQSVPCLCFLPISGWRVPDKRPSGRQGACQARAGVLWLQLYILRCSCLAASCPAERLAARRGTVGPPTSKQNGAALLGPSTATSRALISRSTWPDSGQGLSPATTHPVSLRLCTANKTPPQGTCCLRGTGLQSPSHVSMDQQPRFTDENGSEKVCPGGSSQYLVLRSLGTQFRNLPRPAAWLEMRRLRADPTVSGHRREH